MRIVIVAVVVVILIFGIGLLMKIRPRPAQEPVAEPAQKEPSLQGEPADPSDRPDPRDHDTANPMKGSISGRVYEAESGKGRGGIQVVAYCYRLRDNVKAMTDASGNYCLKNLPPDEYGVSVSDAMAMMESFSEISLSPGQAVTGVDFIVFPGGPLMGTVVEANGTPAANAEVCTRYREGGPIKTKADGSFVIEDVGGRGRDCVVAKKEGRISEVSGPIREDNVPKGEIVLTLHPAGSIEGHVVDEFGNPVTNVRIVAYPCVGSPYLSLYKEVDETGHFLIERTTSAIYRLEVTKAPPRRGGPVQRVLRELFETRDERQAAWRDVWKPLAPVKYVRATLGSRVGGVTITLPKPETNSLWGTVRRADGGPLTDVSLIINEDWNHSFREEDCENFRFDRLPDRPMVLGLDGKNYSAQWAVTELNRELNIVIPEPTTVSGRVINASTGQPLTRFVVGLELETLAKNDAVGTPISSVNSYRTQRFVRYDDADGRFRMKDVYGERVNIEIRAKGYFVEGVEINMPPDGGIREDVEVKLTPCPPIKGRVLSPEGKPVAGAHVVTHRTGALARMENCSTQTDSEGMFQLDNYPRNMEGIRAGSRKYGMAKQTITAEEAARTPIELMLRPGGNVEISAKRGDEALLEGIVQLHREEGPPLISSLDDKPDGTLIFPNLRVGEVTLKYSLTKPFSMPYRTSHVRHMTIREGETERIEFSLPEKTSILRGSVTFSGQVVPAGTVTATSPVLASGEQVVGESPIDRRGQYFLGDLPGGIYTIEATAKGNDGKPSSMRMDVDLAAGQDYTQDLDIEP